MDLIDYKRADILAQFVQERGKILPRRMTGVCARHQRWLGVADSIIKYQTVRLDEDLKRQKKLSHKREVRAARRPRRTPAPAPAPTPAASQGEPATPAN